MMNPTNNPPPETAPPSGEDQHQAMLFASLVMQQTQMATVFLGQAPNPRTGETATDIQSAAVFIDTLEMLAAKTKGNLSKVEHDLLQQSLTSLRMAFVAAVDARPPAAPEPSPTAPANVPPSPSAEPPPPADPATASAEDPRKKFVKKY